VNNVNGQKSTSHLQASLFSGEYDQKEMSDYIHLVRKNNILDKICN